MINEINKNQIFLSGNSSKLFFSVAVISSVALTILWVGNFSTMDSFVSLNLLGIETIAILGFCIQIFCLQNKSEQKAKASTVFVHNKKPPELTSVALQQRATAFSETVQRLPNHESNLVSSPIPRIESIATEMTLSVVPLPISVSNKASQTSKDLMPLKEEPVSQSLVESGTLIVQGPNVVYSTHNSLAYQAITAQWRQACEENPDLNQIQVKFLSLGELNGNFHELHFWTDYYCLRSTLLWRFPKISETLNQHFTMRLGADHTLQSKLAERADMLATEIGKQTDLNFCPQIPLSIDDWIQNEVFPPIPKRSKEGLIIGEMSHSLSSPKKFIIEKMEFFKNLGVKILFLEHFAMEAAQPWFDSYHKTRILPLPLKVYIQALDVDIVCKRYTFLALIQAAHAAGIQIRCIEADVSRAFESRMQRRLSDMNYIATRIMEHETQRWIAFMGAFHASDCISKNYGTSAGIRQLLKQPTIVMDSGPLDKISFNERVYHAKNDSRDPQNPGEAQIGPIDALMIIKEPEIASSSEVIQ